MKQITSQRLTNLENDLKALKSVCLISGSLVNFEVQKSETWNHHVDGEATIKVKVTFKPNIREPQNAITRLSLIIKATQTLVGDLIIDSPTLTFNDRGLTDENGNLYIEETYYYQGFGLSMDFDYYAIASGAGSGDFDVEVTEIRADEEEYL